MAASPVSPRRIRQRSRRQRVPRELPRVLAPDVSSRPSCSRQVREPTRRQERRPRAERDLTSVQSRMRTGKGVKWGRVTGRRFAPLGVRPFGRLLTAYTVNEIGDSVGIVALAVLVYDRTTAVAPTAAIFVAAKFLPALLAPLLTARVDQWALRKVLPALYVVEAAVFAALGLIADGSFVLVLVLALGLVDGTLAITGRGLTRGAVAAVL